MAQSARAAFQLMQSVSHLLHRGQQMAEDRFNQVADGKATPRQFAVLAAIADNPGRTQTDLVFSTGIDRSTLADMITRMEKRKWIVRVTSRDDARAKIVTLASAGRAVFQACIPAAKAADDAVLEALPRGERKSFLDVLTTLSKAADAAAQASERPAKKAPPKPAKPASKKKAAKKGKRRR